MPKEERQYAKKGLCQRTVCQEKKAFRQGTLLSDKNFGKIYETRNETK